MKIVFFIAVFFSTTMFINVHVYGQSSYQITGQLLDTFTFAIPSNAHIILLKDKDTLIQSSTDKDAQFSLVVHQQGNYQLLINHSNYFPIEMSLTITDDKEIKLGLIHLDIKSKLLNEIVIKDNSINRIAQDTTEFIADSFAIRKFSSAKELINKIPGITLSPDGRLTYNGRPISEVNLDGVSFLSFDPDRLLNILRGKDIDKVQLFEVQSQNERLTGIDDNYRGIGLNLKLKEEAKRGYYGKLTGGIGIQKSTHWDNSGNLNSFNNDRRIMVFAESNNTASTSSFGEMTLPQLAPAPQGNPKFFSAGGHYDTRLLKNQKLSFNLDYVFNKTLQNVMSNSNAINLIPDNEFTTQQQSNSTGDMIVHNTNINLNYRISSSSSISASINSNVNAGETQQQSYAASADSLGNNINTSTSQNNAKLMAPNATVNISYNKTFAKIGRALNISAVTSQNKNNSDMMQLSRSAYNSNPTEEIINQQKNNIQNSQNYILNLRYSEPLSQRWLLNFSYNSMISNSLSDNKTYDVFADSATVNNTLNPLYSNKYNFDNFQNKINTSMRFQSKKLFFSVGLDATFLQLDQHDWSNDIALQKNYFNLLPSTSLRYKINSKYTLGAEYKAQTRQPQLYQIQPFSNNNNPLHIVIGNPDLTQSYTHNFTLSFNNFNPSKNKYFNLNGNFYFVQNDIGLKQFYNNDAKEVSQFYNVNGNYSGQFNANYNTRVFSKIQLVLNENYSFSKNKTFLNNSGNNTFNQQYQTSASLIYTLDTLLNITYSTAFNYSIASSSLINNASKIWGLIQNVEFNYFLPKGLSLGTRINWSLRPKVSDNDRNASILLCNVFVGKYFTKSQAFMLKIYVYDFLNQSSNNEVYYGPNIRQESTSNTIGRYAMVGIIWNFTKRKQL